MTKPKNRKTSKNWPSVRVASDLVARGYRVSSDDEYLIAEKGGKKWIIKVVEIQDEKEND